MRADAVGVRALLATLAMTAGGPAVAFEPVLTFTRYDEDIVYIARPHHGTGQVTLVEVDLAASLPKNVYTSVSPDRPTAVDISSTSLVYTLPRGRLEFLELGPNPLATTLPLVGDATTRCAVNTPGNRAILQYANRLETMDVEINAMTWPLELAEQGTVTALGASEFRLFVGFSTGRVLVYDLEYGRLLDKFDRDTAVTAFASQRDGLLVVGYAAGNVLGWNLENHGLAWEQTVTGEGPVSHLAVADVESQLAVSRSAAPPYIYHASLGTVVGQLKVSGTQTVRAVTVGRMGRIGVLWSDQFLTIHDGESLVTSDRVYIPNF